MITETAIYMTSAILFWYLIGIFGTLFFVEYLGFDPYQGKTGVVVYLIDITFHPLFLLVMFGLFLWDREKAGSVMAKVKEGFQKRR